MQRRMRKDDIVPTLRILDDFEFERLTDNFKKLRIYGILFTSMLTLSHAFSIAVLSIDIFGYATVFDWMVFLSLFLLPGSEVFNQQLTTFLVVAMVWRLAVFFLCSYRQFRRALPGR